MTDRAPYTPPGGLRAIAAAVACAGLLAPAAAGQGSPSAAADPDVPRLFDPRTRAPAPRFFDANGSAPQAEVPRLFRQGGARRAGRGVDAAQDSAYPWDKRFRSAVAYARARRGRVALAVVDDRGRARAYRGDERHRSASLVKAMLMVAYLNRSPVRDRDLIRADRALLRPMIVKSDNEAATRVRNIVGNPALAGLARRAGMKRFATSPNWGNTLVTAADQALLFTKIDLLVVARHRAYARKLLALIVPEQRWGVPRALPGGWAVFFKGGWRRGLVNQAALLERGERRVGLAVLTDGIPSHAYGTETVRAVARRLLRGLR